MAVPAWLAKIAVGKAAEWFVKRRLKKKAERLMEGYTVKPGVQTSEFYLTIGTFVAALIAKKFGTDIPGEAVAALVAYILSRGLTKLMQRKG